MSGLNDLGTLMLMIPWFFSEIMSTRGSYFSRIPVPDNDLVFSPSVINWSHQEVHKSSEWNNTDDHECRDNVDLDQPRHFRNSIDIWIE